LDGELICLDSKGLSRFNALLKGNAQSILCAFDLLWLNGEDLRQLPLFIQKERLQRLLESSDTGRILARNTWKTAAKSSLRRFANVIWRGSRQEETQRLPSRWNRLAEDQESEILASRGQTRTPDAGKDSLEIQGQLQRPGTQSWIVSSTNTTNAEQSQSLGRNCTRSIG